MPTDPTGVEAPLAGEPQPVDNSTTGRSLAAHRHDLAKPEDVIAQAIRIADGAHTMGAGALGEVAVKALRDAGYLLMQPVCERCDDESGWYE